MNGSTITVTILEAQELIGAFNKDVFVRVTNEGSIFKTENIRYKPTLTIWNETFNAYNNICLLYNICYFIKLIREVKTGMDEVLIEVVAITGNNEEIIGELQIPISRLKDQYKHDEWFDLMDNHGNLGAGRIHLSLHWIYSRVKYLADVVKKWDDHINMQHEDKIDFEKDLRILYEPFPKLAKACHIYEDFTESKPRDLEPGNFFSMSSDRNVSALQKDNGGDQQFYSVNAFPIEQNKYYDYSQEHQFNQAYIPSNVSSSTDLGMLLTLQGEKRWKPFSVIGTLLLLGLTLVICFARANYLDVRALKV